MILYNNLWNIESHADLAVDGLCKGIYAGIVFLPDYHQTYNLLFSLCQKKNLAKLGDGRG
jgi:hypothetical protein